MNKRTRKIKSANKLLRRQRKTLGAFHKANLAALAAHFSTVVATISAAKQMKVATKQQIADETLQELKKINDSIHAAMRNLHTFRIENHNGVVIMEGGK